MKRDQDWDSMKHTALSYSFTPKEFYFFFFKTEMSGLRGENAPPERILLDQRGDTRHIYPGDGKCKYEEG